MAIETASGGYVPEAPSSSFNPCHSAVVMGFVSLSYMHETQPVASAGADLRSAKAVMIMTHGRGADANDMLGLARELMIPGFAFLAPNAENHTWYPYSFMAPRQQNEPWLSSALLTIGTVLADAQRQSGLPASQIMLLGFSQGACLSSEYAMRHPQRYGGVMVLSGGLIGAPGTTWDDVSGGFDGTPVFLGCSDVDPHIPKDRVIESEAVFERLGAEVTRRLYPGMPHTVNADEIAEMRRVMHAVISG
jgi:phospholipase/carboxylesterase